VIQQCERRELEEKEAQIEDETMNFETIDANQSADSHEGTDPADDFEKFCTEFWQKYVGVARIDAAEQDIAADKVDDASDTFSEGIDFQLADAADAADADHHGNQEVGGEVLVTTEGIKHNEAIDAGSASTLKVGKGTRFGNHAVYEQASSTGLKDFKNMSPSPPPMSSLPLNGLLIDRILMSTHSSDFSAPVQDSMSTPNFEPDSSRQLSASRAIIQNTTKINGIRDAMYKSHSTHLPP
jgi:hypothetical protein